MVSLRILKGGVILCVCGLVFGCGSNLCEDEIIEKSLSPNKELNLIVSQKKCGATTSDSYFVYITNNNDIEKDDKPLFVADKVDGLNVSWIDDNSVLFNYASARIFSFKNFWTKRINNEYKEVSISEKQR